MDKKKLLAGTMALALSTTMLTACHSENNNDEESNNEINNGDIYYGVSEGEKQIFEPYEHVFFVRYNELSLDSEDTIGASVEIPDGYEILSIEQFYKSSYSTTPTGGYDIWYTNNETVEVEAVYNKSFGRNDFSQFGKVIENEDLKENSQNVKKY